MRRIAVVMAPAESDPDGRTRYEGFLQELQKRGWVNGRNVRIDVHWTGGSAERMRQSVAEFVALKPDVIIANGSPTVAALKRATSSIPVVFVLINEPVLQGFIASMARPGGNITGFTQVDFSVVGKSVETLKTMAPALTPIGLMYNPDTYSFYDDYLRALQADARRVMEVTRAGVRSSADIDAAIAEIATLGGGLAVLPDVFNSGKQAAIGAALERHRLPHIVPWRQFVSRGGLMSYGPDLTDIFRRSADYVDRILKGANPAELPAQAPTKFELVINLKTAKALGLDVPATLLARADEVIE
jgi:putative ABC transport system substrate-binding protein